MTKYRSKRTEYNGITYDSKAEAARAAELDLLQKAGEILFWFRQVTVRLGVPENVYRVDFLVIVDGYDEQSWCEDVKGMETAKFKRDKKLWKKYGPLELRIIRKGRVVESIPRGEKA